MDHSVRSPTEAYDGSSAEAHAGPPAGDNIESPADQHSVEYKLDAIDVEAVKLSTGSRLLKLETNVVAKDFIAQSLKDRLKEDKQAESAVKLDKLEATLDGKKQSGLSVKLDKLDKTVEEIKEAMFLHVELEARVRNVGLFHSSMITLADNPLNLISRLHSCLTDKEISACPVSIKEMRSITSWGRADEILLELREPTTGSATDKENRVAKLMGLPKDWATMALN
ncbi:hypothetical protein MMC10_007071 [Thelotrema lepadinum]|nr:hypothetical protein [Thelotrema lepadinum]